MVKIIMRKYLLKASNSAIGKARGLRKNMTEAEKKLWSQLRNHKLRVHFRRQTVVGPYILDFFSPQAKLVIELDGSQHYQEDAQEYDSKRDDFLKAHGLLTLRFNDLEFLRNPNGVLEKRHEKIQKRL